jgi:glycerol-3-phosphate dehydrogenase (NAD(P)+)
VGIVSGPSFAEEVARGLPTALSVAATDPAIAARVAALLRADNLRAYQCDDIAGVEVGGAVKNVLAIAAGASDGLGFGHNARAALITRGLAETGRLSAALGGQRETLMGLAGLGDLVLTCTGDLSRNRRVGLALARGKTLPAILDELGHVAEGVAATVAVRALAREHGVEMPICDAVHDVLYGGLPAKVAVEALLKREPRAEGG